MTDTADLTDPQHRALAWLATGGWHSPGMIGMAMGETTAKRYKAQVQGRRGATMGNRLVKMGFARHRCGSGWGLTYAITEAGRAALRARQSETPDLQESE